MLGTGTGGERCKGVPGCVCEDGKKILGLGSEFCCMEVRSVWGSAVNVPRPPMLSVHFLLFDSDSTEYLISSTVLGKGKYSVCYAAIRVRAFKRHVRVTDSEISDLSENSQSDDEDKEEVVVKALKPVRSKKYKREILILEHLKGGTNVIGMYENLFQSIFP